MDEQIITQEGLDKFKKELEHLKDIRRHEIAERIERAKELGDLTENAEYSDAKDEQALNEGRIIEIESLLKKLTVVESGKGSGKSDTVDLGSTVKVQVNSQEKEYIIVSFNEVDPEQNKISNESPLGQALIGKRVGEEVTVEAPNGEVKYKILEIK